MDFSDFTKLSVREALLKLEASPSGLTTSEANSRLNKYGPNQIASGSTTWTKILIRQLKSPFFYLLFAAVAITFLLGEKIDSVLILVFISINVGLGFLQEYRSEQAIKLLQKFIVRKIKIIRDNNEKLILATDLVSGDIILLEPGNIVPADIRIIESDAITADEEVLTGEPVHVQKLGTPLSGTVTELYEAQNILFSGTTIISGKGKGVVFATGGKTQFGNIAKLTTETVRVSTFEKDLTKFSTYILRLVVLTILAIMIINIFLKKGHETFSELALFSVALAVSVIPEALPVVTTFSLSQGSLKLARKKVVVKRLSSIEDLGGVEVLCTDKTGTLTQNKLAVTDTYSSEKEKLLLFSNMASEKSRVDSFDKALWIAIDNKDIFDEFDQIDLIPFDPFRKRTTSLVKKNKQYFLVSRGAPEEILEISSNISSKYKKELESWVTQRGLAGQRILAVAYKPVRYSKLKSLQNSERKMHFLGLIAFSDPIKPTTHEAVNLAKSLDVKIKIITGDSVEVASALAYEAGIDDKLTLGITGKQFENLSTEAQHEVVEKFNVFARVTPEQKYKIIKLLQEHHEVGFLGEGINDAPALKIANVSLVVESASDIARETADIILLQKDLKVIIDGIKEGRKVYANNTKYITATLSSNFGNFYAVGIASLLIDYLPMLPLQILLVNLLSDFPMISIAADTVDDSEIASPKRQTLRYITSKATLLGIVSTVFDFIFFAIFYRISPATLQTGWFITSIITELMFLFSIRSERFFLRTKRPAMILFVLTSVAFGLTLILPYTQIGKNLFEFTQLTQLQLIIILLIAFADFIFTETAKLIFVRVNQKSVVGLTHN